MIKNFKINFKDYNLSHLEMADDFENLNQEIDVLIGQDYINSFFILGPFPINETLSLHHTHLGYVVAGSLITEQTKGNK